MAPAPPAGAVQFLGKEAAYWRLRIKGAALLVVTLGIYRFWFATDVRRYLWSSTEIGGDSFEYTGLATELLGGFLVALAILAPLYTAIAGMALAFDAEQGSTAIMLFLLIVLLGQFALYRARRYRLTRTVLRGVRFDQHGSAWRYAFYALFWWSLAIVTLGLAYPWTQARLQRYKMRYTSYGNLQGKFAGSGMALFLRGLPIWLAIVGPVLFAFLALAALVDWDALNNAFAQGDDAAKKNIVGAFVNRGAGAVGAAFAISVLAAMLLYPVFQATVMRWWISGLRFGPIAVTSRLRTGQVYRVYLRFILRLVLFALAIAVVTAGIVTMLGVLGVFVTPDTKQLIVSAVSLVVYLIAALGISTIYQVTVTFAMWRLGAQSAELSGAEALDSVRAAGAASSALGEGLADALGVGGI